jgi:hypothetical protein
MGACIVMDLTYVFSLRPLRAVALRFCFCRACLLPSNFPSFSVARKIRSLWGGTGTEPILGRCGSL